MSIDYWRQLDIFDPKAYDGVKVCIVGAGAIGSMTGIVLSKMGLTNLKVWDDDDIEKHNLPNQMYPLIGIGEKKVNALKGIIESFIGKAIEVVPKKWNGDDFGSNVIVIVCTDNMKTRKQVWEKVKLDANVKLFIDARMGGETMRVYSIDPMSVKQGKRYEETLYTDEQAVELPCTAQSIIYNLAGISSIIASQIKKKLRNEGRSDEFFHGIVFDYKCMVLEKERFDGDDN